MNGEIEADSFIKGVDISDWIAQNQPGGSAQRGQAMSTKELDRRLSAFSPKVLEPQLAGLPKAKPGVPPAARRKARAQALLDAGRLGPGNAALSARLGALVGTSVEAKLVSPELAHTGDRPPSAPETVVDPGRSR